MRIGRKARGAFIGVGDEQRIAAIARRRMNWAASMRTASRPGALQPLRFGGLVAAAALFAPKGETGAALIGFAVFGLRASLLPRRWDLAIFVSFGGVRRRECDPGGSLARDACRRRREVAQITLSAIYR
jgi:hypothetical protein